MNKTMLYKPISSTTQQKMKPRYQICIPKVIIDKYDDDSFGKTSREKT